MFETAVMVAEVDVLCNSIMSGEHNIYLLLITRHTNTHPKLDPKFRLHRYSRCAIKYIKIGRFNAMRAGQVVGSITSNENTC